MRKTSHIKGAANRAATLLVFVGIILAATPALAAGQADLAQVRRATAAFHDVAAAEAAGYEEFLPCFDNPGVGGMGQHYVDLAALADGGVVEAAHPEALVYEVRPDGRLKLVAVEYIVPAGFVDPANPPELFGQSFHENTTLGVWVLHAWIWQSNPTGIFEDWNPRIGVCPA